MNEMTIKSKIDGKEISLSLAQTEVATAISVCEKSSMEEVIIMKKPHKGGALFFSNSINAAACQDRHGFDHAFTVKLSELKKFKPDAEPVKKVDPRDAQIAELKDKVEVLTKQGEANSGAAAQLGDKDAEIELLKGEVEANVAEIAKLSKK